MIHGKLLLAFGHESFKFVTYLRAMVGWPTMAVTGNRQVRFEFSGERA